MSTDQQPPIPDGNPYSSPETGEALAGDEGAAREPQEKPSPALTFMAVILIGVVTLFSSGIAFCCTCYPIGLFGFAFSESANNPNLGGLVAILALGGGIAAACVVGYYVARSLWRMHMGKA